MRAAASGSGPVALLVKSWEPPLGELVDFLCDLREATGDGRPIGVLAPAPQAEAAPDPAHLETWRRALSRIGDPWLTVYGLPS